MLFSDQLDRFSPYMLAVLRIVTALLFMEHGTQKLLGLPPGSFPQPPVFSLSGLAGILEMVGGVMILTACSPEQWLSFWRGKWLSPTSSAMPQRVSFR